MAEKRQHARRRAEAKAKREASDVEATVAYQGRYEQRNLQRVQRREQRAKQKQLLEQELEFDDYDDGEEGGEVLRVAPKLRRLIQIACRNLGHDNGAGPSKEAEKYGGQGDKKEDEHQGMARYRRLNRGTCLPDEVSEDDNESFVTHPKAAPKLESEAKVAVELNGAAIEYAIAMKAEKMDGSSPKSKAEEIKLKLKKLRLEKQEVDLELQLLALGAD